MADSSSTRISFGPTASGGSALGPYRPAVLQQAQALSYARDNKHSLPACIPIPHGANLALNPENSQVQLLLELEVFNIERAGFLDTLGKSRSNPAKSRSLGPGLTRFPPNVIHFRFPQPLF